MFHRETDAAKVARNREAIFDLHAAALAWLEQYTGIPYPWGKFDFLLVPSFQFGGMEHPGAIFYNASGLLLDQSATQNQLLGRASVIAHETAHMWFGDLVTMRWFNDVWMKEVFANFMAAKIVNPSFPTINHELRFLFSNYPTAYDVDRTAGTNAIRQALDNLDDAGTLYGAIIYQKAPIVMRQLERILGETPFRDGLREYLRGHSFGNATWSDLVALLDARTPEDLAGWSHAWVEEPGRPVITTKLRLNNGKIESLEFRQADPVSGRGLTWAQHLQVLVSSGGQVRTLPVNLSGPVVNVPAAVGLPAPDFVLPSGEGIGYGGFVLDDGSRAYLLAHLPEIPDALTRGAAWVTLWEEMLDGRASAAALLDLAMRALPTEQDELTVARILGYTEQAYWKFVDEPTRARVTPDLERVLRAGLDRSATASLKSAWFSTLRDTARSRPGPGVARTDLAQDRNRPRPAVGGTGRHRAGAGARGPGGAGVAGDPRAAAGAHAEPGSQGALRVRSSCAVARSGDPRRLLREPRGPGQPTPRALGARRSRLPAPSAAGRRLRALHRGQPRDAARDPAYRGHLLSRSDGPTPRSAATPPHRQPGSWPASSPRCRRTIRIACGACCSRRPTICSAPSAAADRERNRQVPRRRAGSAGRGRTE